jgi:hypothetical protein
MQCECRFWQEFPGSTTCDLRDLRDLFTAFTSESRGVPLP